MNKIFTISGIRIVHYLHKNWFILKDVYQAIGRNVDAKTLLKIYLKKDTVYKISCQYQKKFGLEEEETYLIYITNKLLTQINKSINNNYNF